MSNSQFNCCNCNCNCNCNGDPSVLTHVHEIVGSVRLAELNEDPHNHRFAGLSGEVIPVEGGHVHMFRTTTDFYEDHFHEICVRTGLPVPVGSGEDARHVHFIDAATAIAEEHFHEFIVATLIQNPIGD